MILLANSIWVLTDDRMAHLGLKPQAGQQRSGEIASSIQDWGLGACHQT